MAFRIGDFVERGWLDTSVKGAITGEFWLAGRPDPIRLDLQGYPHADLAGTLLSFTNPNASAHENALSLDAEQKGVAGDITAARKARDIEQRREDGSIPIINVLYLEWFSERNGRVVIEAGHYELRTHGPSVWQLTDADEIKRQEWVGEGMLWFMNRICEIADQRTEQTEESPEDPMDEFAWERLLKDSDKRTEEYGRLLEKYADHPDRERLIAREMGWDHLEDLMDADARGLFGSSTGEEECSCGSDTDEEDSESWGDLEDDFDLNDMLDPEREGVDWVRTEQGRIYHPICLQAMSIYEALFQDIKGRGLLEVTEPADPVTEKLQDMVISVRILSIKLAGALNGLGYDRDLAFTAGMVVAQLKRAMSHFNEAIWHIDGLSTLNPEFNSFLDPARKRLFTLREQMLGQMQRFRGYIQSDRF